MTRSTPLRVCVVCAGNICRSPMAEVVLRTKLAAAGLSDSVIVDSAGTGDWHIGGNASRGALDALGRRGYDSSHAARQFDRRWFAERDLVLALDSDNARDLRRLAPDAASRAKVRMLGSYAEPTDISAAEADVELSQSVPDPYGGSADDFDHALDLIESACEGLVRSMSVERQALGPSVSTHEPAVIDS